MSTTDKANEIQRTLAAAVEKHRGNANLSAEGKKRLYAAAYVNARKKLETLKQTERQAFERSRDEVERKLFGLPNNRDASAVISFRDAQDRAGRIENPEEATALLRRAQNSGDVQLARAIVGQAFEAGWADVVDRFVETEPDLADTVDQLIGLNAADAHSKTQEGRIGDSMTFYLPKPVEIRDVGDGQLEQLAREAPQVTETPGQPGYETSAAPVSAWRLRGDTVANADGWA